MKFTLKNAATKEQLIEIDRSIWTGKTIIKVDGIETKKLSRLEFSYVDKDNQNSHIKLQGNDLRGLQAVINGKVVDLNKKLSSFEYTLVLLPLLLTFIFMIINGGGAILGAISGFIGILFGYLNASLIRETNKLFLKILLSIALSAASVFAFIFVAILF